MADLAQSSDSFERYAAIEQAYCEDRWRAVVQDGQAMLSDLARAGESSPEGLKERLQLLMAHAYLYGFGERDNAEDLYQAVLRSGAEASLRQIAEEGLRQCNLPVATTTSELSEDPAPQENDPFTPSGGFADRERDPLRWDEPPVAPDPDPALDGPSTSVSGTPAGEPVSPAASRDQPLSLAKTPQPVAEAWLSAAPAASPAPAATEPVMPWLEQAAAPAGAPVEDSSPALPWPDAAPEREPSGSPEVPAAAETSPSLPEAEEAPAPLSPLRSSVSAVEASLQPEVGGAGRPDGEPPTVAPQEARPAVDPVPVAPLLGSAPAGLTLQSPSVEASLSPLSHADLPEVAASPATPSESLIPEVVEEPELIELHQADPLRLEELELSIGESLPPSGFRAEPVGLVAGIPLDPPDPPGADPEEMAVEGVMVEDVTEQQPRSAVPGESPGIRRQRSHRPGPFARPPVSVAEEDPEMLMGLLRVEMG